MSISNTTLERKKPKLESQHIPTSYPAPPPCSLAVNTLPKKGAAPTTLEQSKRKKLKLEFAANEQLLYYSRTSLIRIERDHADPIRIHEISGLTDVINLL